MSDSQRALDDELLGESSAEGGREVKNETTTKAGAADFTSSEDENGDDQKGMSGTTAVEKGKKRARSISDTHETADHLHQPRPSSSSGRKKSISQASPARKKARKSISAIPLPAPSPSFSSEAPATQPTVPVPSVLAAVPSVLTGLYPSTPLTSSDLIPPPMLRRVSLQSSTGTDSGLPLIQPYGGQNATASSSTVPLVEPKPKAKRKSRSKAALNAEASSGLSGLDAMMLEAAGQPMSRGGSPMGSAAGSVAPKPKRRYNKKPGEPGPGKNWRKGLKDSERIPGSGRSSAASSVEPSLIGYTPSSLVPSDSQGSFTGFTGGTPHQTYGHPMPFDRTPLGASPMATGLFSAGSLLRNKSQIVDDDIVELLDSPNPRSTVKAEPDPETIVLSGDESDAEMPQWPQPKNGLGNGLFPSESEPYSIPPPQQRGLSAEELKAPADATKLGYPVYSRQIPGKAIPVYRIPSPVRIKEKETAIPLLIRDNVGERPRTWQIGTRIILGVGGSHLKLKSWMSTSPSPFALQKQAEIEQRARLAYGQQVYLQSQAQPGFQPVSGWASSLPLQGYAQMPGTDLYGALPIANGPAGLLTQAALPVPGDAYAGSPYQAGLAPPAVGFNGQPILNQPPPIPGMQKKKRGKKPKKEAVDGAGEKVVKPRINKIKYGGLMAFDRPVGSPAGEGVVGSSPPPQAQGGPIAIEGQEQASGGPPQGANWTSVHPSSVSGFIVVDLKAGPSSSSIAPGGSESQDRAVLPMEESMDIDRAMEELL